AGNGVSGLPDGRADRHPDSAAVPMLVVARNVRRFIRVINVLVTGISYFLEGAFPTLYARIVVIRSYSTCRQNPTTDSAVGS
ncbi:hypothetical protein, partial [Haloferax sp. Atlit-6N]|uniref:hypothetical protein n=1 Tax=Haloferax sp. Atlit-6N TaxID=2077205 RepID=UPI001F3A09EC